MNLIELYIQEVTRRLPEKNREDIALELRSTIEDMLPDDYSEQDVKTALVQLGNPASLASGYLDKPRYLIGPQYFDVYVSLIKMILPIAMIIAFISIVADAIITYDGVAILNVILHAIGGGIWWMLSTMIQVLFWITVTFAILERTDQSKNHFSPLLGLKEWTPDDLKEIKYIPKEKAIPKGEVFFSLIWTAIWATVYFNAAHLIGVYQKGQGGLEFVTPTFNQEVLHSYWLLVVIVIGLEVITAICKQVKAQWTMGIAILNAVLQVVSSIVFIVIISNDQLINESFIRFQNELFNTTSDAWLGWVYAVAVFTFLLFAVIEIYRGFRKALAYKGLK
ncbi:HAAS signaling domain-containing protein [Sutcliffiella halmapala]|uniref:HAAS signaling domain-containing protein n=1 Tax=Sutcliffiella halmapala TaxID=79882 RepID=UPI000994AA86|nr:hypothetical protein [Sutcliffiella halmapala]